MEGTYEICALYIPSFIMIGSGVRKLSGSGESTYRYIHSKVIS
jgi:hypothetical protein